MSDEAQRMIATAADIIRKKGWTQFLSRDTHGRHCILGALDQAAVRIIYPNTVFPGESYNEAKRRIAALVAPDVLAQNQLSPGCLSVGYAIADWNDTRGRTVQEVLDVLTAAAAVEGDSE